MPTFLFRPVRAVLDVPPDAAPLDAWTGVADVVFRDGVATRVEGEARQFPDASVSICTPEFVMPAGAGPATAYGSGYGDNPQHAWWAVGNDATPQIKVQEWRTTTVTDRTPASWSGLQYGSVNAVTGGSINGWGFINVADKPRSLVTGRAGDSAALGDTLIPTIVANGRFRAARAYGYQIVGMGLYDPSGPTEYPTRVNWSNLAPPDNPPTTFLAAAGNDAGSADIVGVSGRLEDGGQLGRDFIVYGNGSTHVMTFVGGAEVMRIEKLSGASGIMARNCWADIGSGHVVMTADDVVLVTVGGITSLATPAVRRALFGGTSTLTRAPLLKNYCHVVHHLPAREVWVCVPTNISDTWCSEAFVYSLDSGAWGRRTLVARQTGAASGPCLLNDLRSASINATVIAAGTGLSIASGRLWLADEPASGNYSTRNPLLQRHDLDLGEPGRVKTVRAVRPRLREIDGAVANIDVRVGGRNSVTEAISWSGWTDYAPSTDDTVHLFATGRLISVEVRDVNGTKPWQMPGLDIDFDLRGRW